MKKPVSDVSQAGVMVSKKCLQLLYDVMRVSAKGDWAVRLKHFD
jgi:hypothetical protein